MDNLSPMQLRDRYMEDVHFRAIVDQLKNFMHQNKVQPYEVRDAAFIAELLYREETAMPVWQILREGKQ